MTRRKFYNSNAPVISRLLSVLQLSLYRRILPFKASNANLGFVEQTRRSGKNNNECLGNNSVDPTAAGFATWTDSDRIYSYFIQGIRIG